jgi:hypothetical protein
MLTVTLEETLLQYNLELPDCALRLKWTTLDRAGRNSLEKKPFHSHGNSQDNNKTRSFVRINVVPPQIVPSFIIQSHAP